MKKSAAGPALCPPFEETYFAVSRGKARTAPITPTAQVAASTWDLMREKAMDRLNAVRDLHFSADCRTRIVVKPMRINKRNCVLRVRFRSITRRWGCRYVNAKHTPSRENAAAAKAGALRFFWKTGLKIRLN